MTDHAKQILVDAFGRVRELVIDLTDGLTDEIATLPPRSRSELHRMAGLASQPNPRRSRGRGGAGRAGVAGVAREVRAALRQVGHRLRPRPRGRRGCPGSGELLSGYHGAVHELTLRYLERHHAPPSWIG